MQVTPELLTSFMREALIEAERARAQGEVPVGAVVAHEGAIIARAHNITESAKDPSAHAEILALRSAAALLGDWRLSKAILVVTLEPCTMCAGAIKLARVPVVAFGTEEPRMGAVGTLYDLLQDERTGVPPRVISGILREESRGMLEGFFRGKRS